MKKAKMSVTIPLTKEQIKKIAYRDYCEKNGNYHVEFHFFSKSKSKVLVIDDTFKSIFNSWNMYELLIWRLRFDFSPDVQLKCIKTYLNGKHITIETPEGNDKISKLVNGFWQLNMETYYYLIDIFYNAFLENYNNKKSTTL